MKTSKPHSIKQNFISIKNEIHKTALSCDRNPDDIELVAVSKQQPLDRITTALDYGQRVFGENRIQEALEKWPDLKLSYPDIRLHMIGHLQSNKAAEAVSLFDVIETLDRAKIVDALAREEQTQNRKLSYYIQVNTGNESQKSGVALQDLDALYHHARHAGLNIIGLMCLPPQGEPPGLHFALLQKQAERLGLEKLSMGMSEDFKTAIRFGATGVRIGSALFGRRS